MTFCPNQTVPQQWPLSCFTLKCFICCQVNNTKTKDDEKNPWQLPNIIQQLYIGLSRSQIAVNNPPSPHQPPGASSVLSGRHTTPEWAFTWLSYVTPDNIMAGLLGVLTCRLTLPVGDTHFLAGSGDGRCVSRVIVADELVEGRVQWSVWLFDHWSVWLFDHATP